MRFVIIGGGPAGNQAATHAASRGVDVTLIERDVVGGAANLWDCIPSKAMIATGGAMSNLRRMAGMGVVGSEGVIDLEVVRQRIGAIVDRLEDTNEKILHSQDVNLVRGSARLADAHTVVADTVDGECSFEADSILISTGSRPRVPDWAVLDADRTLSTRDAYPPKVLPEHLVVVGSGVTGVEFVHLFSSLGSEVTLIVSRQQVLPHKDPEVAAVLEADFTGRGVHLLKGARAVGASADGHRGRGPLRRRPDGRRHARPAGCRARFPTRRAWGSSAAGVEVDAGGYVPINRHCQTNVPHIFAAGDLSGKLPLSSVAAMQGRQVAELRGRRSYRWPTAIPTTTVRRPPSSPSRRSPMSAWPRRTPSPRGGRSG